MSVSPFADRMNMRWLRHRIVRRLVWGTVACLALCLGAFLIYFPGRQSLLAFTLGTGIGVAGLQTQVDQLEAKAVKGQELSPAEKQFLRNLYTCFAKGGALVAPQSSKMMHRYLSRTGEPLAVTPGLFTGSAPVRVVMTELKRKVLEDLEGGRGAQERYSSETFYMGDPDHFDAFVGLYYGRLQVTLRSIEGDSIILSWRAEVPWTWPTYAELFQKYGDHHAQSFPLPNARSVLQGQKYCLYMDDGLGGHLSKIGLAKPFLAYSEWEETLSRSDRRLGQQDGAVNRSQQVRPETNQSSAAGGSGR